MNRGYRGNGGDPVTGKRKIPEVFTLANKKGSGGYGTYVFCCQCHTSGPHGIDTLCRSDHGGV